MNDNAHEQEIYEIQFSMRYCCAQSTKVSHTESTVTKVSEQASHITAEYSADIRNRTQQAWVSLHIQKPKPLERVDYY